MAIHGATIGANGTGNVVIDNINLNGTTIGHTDDTDLITLARWCSHLAVKSAMTTLDIGGDNVSATADELNLLDGITLLVVL